MSWNEVGNEQNTEKKEVNYLKFPEGATTIRVLDEVPYSRWTHWLPAPANGGKGVGIDCIGDGCPVCAKIAMEKARGVDRANMKFSSKKTHSINVLVRKPSGDELAILEAGNGIFGNLKDVMVMMGTAGMQPDLRSIDVLVNRTGTGFSNTKYSVMGLMHKVSPLTAEELAIEKYDLNELKPKLTPEQIVAVMEGAKLDEITKSEGSAPQTNNAPVVDFTQQVL